jgi:succinate dehydrogenase flavin-adding protein (antitoxin of CptAB toxin-antitoxin module)
MRELDTLLMRYIDAEYQSASPDHRAAFETLVSLQDPELMDLLRERVVPEDAAIRDVLQRLLAHD